MLKPASAIRGDAPARSGHFPCFDGLRAVAALLVIGVHTSFASGFDGRSWLRPYTSRLEIGVEVFFVISGFLLYRPFAVDHFGGRRALPLKEFWIRRLKRIIPAYWVAFLVITYVMRADMVHHAWYSPLVYLGFAQIYLPNYIVTGITQAWSLCIEVTFYLTLPLYAALLVRTSRSADRQLRVEFAGLATLVAISFAYRIPVLALSIHSPVARTMGVWLPAYLDQFALGMFLAVTSAWLSATDRRPGWLWHPVVPWISWSLAAIAFVGVSNLGLPWQPIATLALGFGLERQTLYGVFAFFVVLPAVFGPQDRGLVRRLLSWRPIALIGVISYGIYLWHEAWLRMFYTWSGDRLFTVPWPDLLGAVTALALVSSAASYLFFERPVLRSRFPRPRNPAPFTLPVSPAGVGS